MGARAFFRFLGFGSPEKEEVAEAVLTINNTAEAHALYFEWQINKMAWKEFERTHGTASDGNFKQRRRHFHKGLNQGIYPLLNLYAEDYFQIVYGKPDKKCKSRFQPKA